MIRVTAHYPARPGARFDWSYYLEQHIPMLRDRFGARMLRCEVYRGVSGMGGAPAPYVCSVHMHFASLPSFQETFDLHGAAVLAELPRYTDIAR